MRDFLAATRERIIVFDGGMGATLEQFDLSLERDYRLPGRCHEALVLNRPDVIESVHTSMLDAGAEVVETDTFQASRLKLPNGGSRTTRSRSTSRRPRSPAAPPASAVRRRLDRPDRLPARQRRSDARADHLPRARHGVHRTGAGARAGGVDLIIIETAQDILELKAAMFGARAAFALEGRTCRSSAACRCCPTVARCCSAPTSARS